MNQVTYFFKSTMAFLKNDKAEQIALKNSQKAESAYRSAISRLKSQLDEDQDKIDEAEERLNKARFPEYIIVDKEDYIRQNNLMKNRLAEAKEAKATTEATIKEYEEEVALLSKMVDYEPQLNNN